MRVLNSGSGRRSFVKRAGAGALLAASGLHNAAAQTLKPLSFKLSWIKSI